MKQRRRMPRSRLDEQIKAARLRAQQGDSAAAAPAAADKPKKAADSSRKAAEASKAAANKDRGVEPRSSLSLNHLPLLSEVCTR